MRPGELANWRMASRHVFNVLRQGATTFATWVLLDEDAHLVSHRLGRLKAHMGEAGLDRWDDRVSRMALEVAGYVPRAMEGRAARAAAPSVDKGVSEDGLPDTGRAFGRDLVALAKAMKLGHAIATRDGSALDAEERAFVDRLMARPSAALSRVKPMSAPPVFARTPSPPSGSTLPFAFVWRRLRPGAVIAQEFVSSTGHASLRTVDALDAPVVARLRVDLSDDRHVDLRLSDGAWYRPVLAPGSWEPVGLAAFASAAASGTAWADNPFVPKDPASRLFLGLPEYAEAGEPRDEAERAARDDAIARAMARCGDLIVVDDVVHRRTEPPRLYLQVGVDPRRPSEVTGFAHVAWRLGDDLAMSDEQAVLGRRVGGHRPLDALGRRGYVEAPMGDLEAFAAFARDWLATAGDLSVAGSKGRRDRGSRPGWSTLVEEDVVEVVRPDLLPRDPAAFARALAAWPDHGMPASQAEAARSHPVMDLVRDAVGAADAGRVTEYPDGAGEALRALVEANVSSHADVFVRALPLALVRAALLASQEPQPDLEGLSL